MSYDACNVLIICRQTLRLTTLDMNVAMPNFITNKIFTFLNASIDWSNFEKKFAAAKTTLI